MNQLDSLTISGFKSIRNLDSFKLNQLNILIGANGAGKSNFIEIFRLLKEMVQQNLHGYVRKNGRVDGLFFHGIQKTKQIKGEFHFGANGYKFELEATADERLLILNEQQKQMKGHWQLIGRNQFESNLVSTKNQQGLTELELGIEHVYLTLSNWIVYHFHVTNNMAPMRRSEIVQDVDYLRQDAANIAPFLLHLKNNFPRAYSEIVDAVRLVTPFFDTFILKPIKQGQEKIVNLSWQQRGSDYPMQPYHYSDGTLRFICLATALLQPKLPSTIIIDEPELGLHPYALAILAELVKAAAQQTQIILSTQSPTLIDYFEPEDLIVVNRNRGASTFERLNQDELKAWLDAYTIGELWQKNIIAGGPGYD